MSFLNDFTKTVSSATRKIAGSSSSIGLDNIAKDLAKAGNSIQGITNTINRVSDTLLSGAAGDFFKGTGLTTSRISESLLNSNRFASSLNSKKYSTDVTPVGKIDSSGSSTKLQFPPDMGEYYIQFSFKEYKRPNIMEPAQTSNGFDIFLPIPAVLQESHTTSWREATQNVLGSIVNELEAQHGQNLSQLVSANNLEALGYGATESISRGLSKIPLVNNFSGEEILGIVNQVAGAIPNPNLSVLFEGPTLRDMNYHWRFHPESPDESDTIKTIINEFRKRMLPNTKGGESGPLILGYPQMVEAKLFPNDDYLYQMKKCVVTGINVDYSPNGVPSFFKGTKAPTVIEFSVSLKEIEYFLSEDFGGDSSSVDFNSIEKDFGLA